MLMPRERDGRRKNMTPSGGEEIAGWLEHDDVRHPLPHGVTVRIGRDPDADVTLDHETVSWAHAEIGPRDGALMVWDSDSHNGTVVEGRALNSYGRRLRHGAVIELGEVRVRFRSHTSPARVEDPPGVRRYSLDHDIRIGRAEDNDVVLDEPNVSRYHALLRLGPPPSIEDLGSRNGTRIGPDPVRRAELASGDEVGIGPYRLSLHGAGLTVSDQRAGVGLRAFNVTVKAGGKTILQPVSLTVGRGEVLALIGSSGAGKSTLLRVLAGISKPSGGEVLVDEDPIASRLADLGYLPQQDTIHERLTVREALAYAAALRLPADTSAAEIAARVDGVLAELEITARAGLLISSLSGGQKKRVACGVELVGQPTMLFLDEPTSGLDPPLERQLMQTVRKLADDGRGVVVTTHATSSIALCDTLAIMAPGGRLAYVGEPQQALARFGVEHYDQLYEAVPTPEVEEEAPPRLPARRLAPTPSLRRRPADHSLLRQLRVFSSRYLRVFLRDRRTLAVLLGQVPAIAVLIALLFDADLLALPDEDPGKSAQFVFLLVTASLWIGLISSCREIVNERSIVLRELSIGARLGAYLGAKVIVLFALAAIQTALLLFLATALRPLHEPASAYLSLYAVLLGTAWAAVTMGLAVSTFARSVDQATSFVPLLLIPQLLFAGALVTVKAMTSVVILVLSDLTVARWAFAGGGGAIEMNARLATDRGQMHLYGPDFFSISPAVATAATLGFAAAGLAVATQLLRRDAARTD
jgi:ABC transport system ATP-binding/permease protein